MKNIGLTLALLVLPIGAMAQSSSPFPVQPEVQRSPIAPFAANAVDVITFSEFPIGTSITNQYGDRGIIFGGDSPFITTDGANPTSPVLSGTPLFTGAIEGQFVDPSDGVTPVIVESFTFDAGYFDALGSTRIEWFDPDGNKLGQRTNTQFAIENFTIEGGNLASWRISILTDEPAGYGIDNVTIKPLQASILFREKSDSEKDGSWGFIGDEIPGFDHVGLQVENIVYESHPGYPSGTYVSEDGQESVFISDQNAVQAQHSKATFEHDAKVAGAPNSPVIDFEEIPIDMTLAQSMKSKVEGQIAAGATFQKIDFSTAEGIEQTLSPAAQKGGDGTFTCVGLVEWAAEQAGHKDGKGFIPNGFESFSYPDLTVFPPVLREAPLLSPQLLNYAMKGTITLDKLKQWAQGFFDPVDFIITDPLGRRLGYTALLGEINEIPYAFFSGDGKYEQFLIPNPVAGRYRVELVGLGAEVTGAFGTSQQSEGVGTFLALGETKPVEFRVSLTPGAPGDVNGDGVIDEDDIVAILQRLNEFTNSADDPADIDGDGLISDADVILLDELISLGAVLTVQVDVKPGSTINPINLGSNGVVSVAVLTTSLADGDDVDFDARTVDPPTLMLAGADVQAKGKSGKVGSFEDVDGDGDLDLIVHFRTRQLQIAESQTTIDLEGMTLDGVSIMGSDSVIVRP